MDMVFSFYIHKQLRNQINNHKNTLSWETLKTKLRLLVHQKNQEGTS